MSKLQMHAAPRISHIGRTKKAEDQFAAWKRGPPREAEVKGRKTMQEVKSTRQKLKVEKKYRKSKL